MASIKVLPVMIREVFGSRVFPREPEPDLVMESEEQVQAYEKAGREDGIMSASYLFHAARISQVVKGAEKIVDLACGPATQLCQVAKLNPNISFLGIDYSEEMLRSAELYSKELGLNNVKFMRGDITDLSDLPQEYCDGVISTMALHHLPSLELLEKCFSETRRILRPGGSLYLADFGRLKSLKSVLFFAYMNREHQPHIFSLDYERSLRAAFLKENFVTLQQNYFPEIQLYSTGLVPLVVVIKSPDRRLGLETVDILKKSRQKLPYKYRRILDDLRTFFAIGGMRNDPFK